MWVWMGIYEGQNAKNYVASLRRAKQIFPEQRPKPCRAPLPPGTRSEAKPTAAIGRCRSALRCRLLSLATAAPHAIVGQRTIRCSNKACGNFEYDCSISPSKLWKSLHEQSEYHGTPNLGRSSVGRPVLFPRMNPGGTKSFGGWRGTKSTWPHYCICSASLPCSQSMYKHSLSHGICTPCSVSPFAYILPLHLRAGHCEGSSFDSFERCCRY